MLSFAGQVADTVVPILFFNSKCIIKMSCQLSHKCADFLSYDKRFLMLFTLSCQLTQPCKSHLSRRTFDAGLKGIRKQCKGFCGCGFLPVCNHFIQASNLD